MRRLIDVVNWFEKAMSSTETKTNVIEQMQLVPSFDANHTTIGVIGVPSEVGVTIPIIDVVDGVGAFLPVGERIVPTLMMNR